MSKLLKSKFLLGVAVFALAFVVAYSASAADGAITMTLKKGMKNVQVKYLQQTLNEKSYTVATTGAGSVGKETTTFGPATVSAVKAFQKAMGLVADGIFGAKSRAALGGSAPVTSSNCPAGALFNPTTGAPCTGTVVNNNPTGPVSVALASNNPASGTIVAGQATADLLHFTLTGTGTLSAITLQRSGISDQSTLSNVYLYDGVTRLTDGYSFNNSGVLTMGSLNIPVAGSRTLSVRADVYGSTTSYNIAIGLTSYTVLGGSASAVSIMGNSMQIATNASLGTISMSANTIGVSSSPSVNPGTTGYTLWSAPISVSTRSLFMKSVSFRVIGSAPTDSLANMNLYKDGSLVGSTNVMASINGSNYISFDFSGAPVELTTGSHTFDVRADVVKGSARTVQLSLQQASDLMVTDNQVGVNVVVTGTIPNSTVYAINISQGTVSVTVDPTFNSYTNVTGGATNVAIAKFKLHAYGEDVKVNTLNILPYTSNSHGLQNVTVYFNGSQVGSQTANWLTGANIALTPGSQMIVPAGVDSFVEVRADLRESTSGTAGTNYTTGNVYATLSSGTGEGWNSKNSITIASQLGNTLAIQTGMVAIAQDSNLGAVSINPNTPNSKIGSFVIQNQSSSEGVHITNLQVGLTLTTADSTNYSNLLVKAADGSVLGGSSTTPINPAYSAASATSTNNIPVDFVLAAGSTKTLYVYVDVGNTAGSLISKLYVTATGSSSNASICSTATTGGTVNGCNTGTAASGQTATIQAGTFGNGGVIVGSSTAVQYVATGSTGLTDGTMATFNFKSANGTTTISELKFKVASSSGTTVSSVRVGSSLPAPVVSGVAYLTGLNLVVPTTGSGLNVPVYMTYAPVGTNLAGVSGATSFVEMIYVKYQVGNTSAELKGGDVTTLTNDTLIDTIVENTSTIDVAGNTETLTLTTAANLAKLQPGMKIAVVRATTNAILEVQSVGSANFVAYTIIQGVGNATGSNAYFISVPQTPDYSSTAENTTGGLGGGTEDAMMVVGSKPTLTVVDSSAQLINGLVKVGSVTVSADSKGDIAVNAIPLTFNSTGYVTVGGTSLVVKNAADQSTVNTTDGTLTVTAGSSGNVTVTFTGGYNITAGQSVTFDVYATAATVSNGPGANVLSMKLNTTGFLWTDVAGNGSAAGRTGALIYNYPTNSSVIND